MRIFAVALPLLLALSAGAGELVVKHGKLQARLSRAPQSPATPWVEPATLTLEGEGEGRIPVAVCADPACTAADVTVLKPAQGELVDVRIPVLSDRPLTLCVRDTCQTEADPRVPLDTIDMRAAPLVHPAPTFSGPPAAWPLPKRAHGAVTLSQALETAPGYAAVLLDDRRLAPLQQAALVALLRDGGVAVGPPGARAVFVGEIDTAKKPAEVIGQQKPAPKDGTPFVLPEGIAVEAEGQSLPAADLAKVRGFAAGSGLYLEVAPDAPAGAVSAALTWSLADQPRRPAEGLLQPALAQLKARGVRQGPAASWLWPLLLLALAAALVALRGRKRAPIAGGLAVASLVATGWLYTLRPLEISKVVLADAVQGAAAAHVASLALWPAGYTGTLASPTGEPVALLALSDGASVRAARTTPDKLEVVDAGGADIALVSTSRAKRRTRIEWNDDAVLLNNAPGARRVTVHRAGQVGSAAVGTARSIAYTALVVRAPETLGEALADAAARACPVTDRAPVSCVVLLFEDEAGAVRIERVRPGPSIPGLVREELVQFKGGAMLPEKPPLGRQPGPPAAPTGP